MGRDSRDSYRGRSRDDRMDAYGASGPRSSPGGMRMSAPGPRSNPGPRNSMPPARSGASGATRVPRRPGAPSDPSSRAYGGGNGNGGGSGPGSRPPVAGGPGDYDGPSSSGRQRARPNGRPLTGDTPPGGRTGSGQRRSMADMARDLSRTMSRQLGAMVARTRGPAYESPPAPRMAPPRRSPMPTSLPPEVTAKLHAQAYRRSRIRLVARKWRLGRVRPNPVAYFAVVLITAVLAVAIAFGGGAGVAYAINYYNSHLADIQAIANLKNADNSTILDRNGKTIATLKGTSDFNFYAPLSQISDKLQWATIDTEDHTFWDNVGIDFQATLRAAFVDVQAGGANQGASSITQQLVKNIVLKDSNKTYIRKLDEAILAYGLTQQYTKAQILEMYLNEVYYSGLYKGVEAASRYFFNLTPYALHPNQPNSPEILANQQLTWGQAALLAALPNNPTIFLPTDYSCTSAPCPQSKWDWPFADPVQPCGAYVDNFWTSEWYLTHGHEWLVYCRVTTAVLPSLVTYGGTGITFTKADSDQAAAEVQTMLEQQQVHPFKAVITNSGDSGQATNLAPHFVEFVANEMSDKFGVGSLETAGLRIYTTLDLNLNRYVQQQIHYYIDEPYKNPWYPSGGCGYSGGIALDCPLSQASNANDGAAVAIDQHTGDILAMVGSADYNNNDPRVAGKLNVTTRARSMGSATKPLVYVTALQMGWTPGIMLQDIPICFPQDGQTPNDPAKACGKHYTPLNYEATKFAGTMPLRYMLGNSLNIPATEAMAFVGDSPAYASAFLAMAQRLGVTSLSRDRMGPTTVLGGQEISLLQLTGAYSVFANGGVRVPPRAILRVEDSNGNVLYQAAPQPKGAQVISPQTAYMLTSVLTDNKARAGDFGYGKNPLHFEPSRDGADLGDFQLAAKTGTSSGAAGPPDIITAGYSPFLTVAVWIGNADGSSMAPGIIGVAGAGYVFHDIMLWSLQHYNWPHDAQFPIPPLMAQADFNCGTGLAPYKGSTAADMTCREVPPSFALTCGCYSKLYDYSGLTGTMTRVNQDWYIQGETPLLS